MIPETKYNTLQELIKTSSREEIIWINGYLNGLVSGVINGDAQPKNGNGHEALVKKFTIAYGTETGNSKKLALQLATSAKQQKFSVKCTALEQFRPEDIAREEYFFVIISTQGEGDPPETAKKFLQYLENDTIRLEGLKYGVLALGDSSYPLFCKTGEDLDLRLQQLGAKRVLPLIKCDVDYEEPAAAWYASIADLLKGGHTENKGIQVSAPAKKSGKHNIEGRISKTINLNDRGSDKQTFHIEISCEEELDYEPGDSIAIVPSNREEVVEKIIALSGVDGNHQISTSKYSGTIRELLSDKLNICYLLSSTVKKYAALTGHDIPNMRLDLVDLLAIYPLNQPEQFIELISQLNPIAPRLYSVSSSASSGNREVHITVSRRRFLKEDEQRYGLCSNFLGDLPVNSKIIFYIHRNRSFKLPAAEKDIIMVGPGTGIAPFRSFLAERDISGAGGRNWLFFGEQHFQTDFLYQTEIQQYLQTGVLQKVSLAFSRDQEEKRYVQHLMKEQGAEIFSWLNNGAIFYISGTKDPMSIEVEKTLLDIIREHGRQSDQDAIEYLDQLKKDERFHKDVY